MGNPSNRKSQARKNGFIYKYILLSGIFRFVYGSLLFKYDKKI